eukprot:CAMPEP_0173378762 /NCGR_PEP_ID=MMETSP1356-20130122/1894_1 /TAXON_ID=77927 ORGANISM="Hemiselmis virescens, Strain PCC157" /NCGR_SAMPLE_ID=MMETSP1356 /ASSEMBLY_ACC=CAM_ASM_000847 /LENGTH=162 /DNA_ID=CAMNT_0014331945 /DNA_START=9 /DNA_END=497 /DNA_ORIENTATION=+
MRASGMNRTVARALGLMMLVSVSISTDATSSNNSCASHGGQCVPSPLHSTGFEVLPNLLSVSDQELLGRLERDLSASMQPASFASPSSDPLLAPPRSSGQRMEGGASNAGFRSVGLFEGGGVAESLMSRGGSGGFVHDSNVLSPGSLLSPKAGGGVDDLGLF